MSQKEAALRLARLVALVVPAGLLAGAYLSQYGFEIGRAHV